MTTSTNIDPTDYIISITDKYLQRIGGELSASTMDMLTGQQHTLLAYRIILDEVMQGGFIQLIQNGYAPYVLEGPFPMLMKNEWGLRDFGKFMYEVRKEYFAHKEALTADLDEEEFMALYEQHERLNSFGDDFLDIYQESITPAIAQYVKEREEEFTTWLE